MYIHIGPSVLHTLPAQHRSLARHWEGALATGIQLFRGRSHHSVNPQQITHVPPIWDLLLILAKHQTEGSNNLQSLQRYK